MEINGIAIAEIWKEIEEYGVDRKRLENINLDNDSLFYIYLTAKNHNDRQKLKKQEDVVV